MFHFSTYIFSADITPDMLKLCRLTEVKVLFLVLVYVFNFNLFEFSAAILEKGLLMKENHRNEAGLLNLGNRSHVSLYKGGFIT